MEQEVKQALNRALGPCQTQLVGPMVIVPYEGVRPFDVSSPLPVTAATGQPGTGLVCVPVMRGRLLMISSHIPHPPQ